MKGDVINETGELSMLPHYFMGMNKKLFLGPVGAAAVPSPRPPPSPRSGRYL